MRSAAVLDLTIVLEQQLSSKASCMHATSVKIREQSISSGSEAGGGCAFAQDSRGTCCKLASIPCFINQPARSGPCQNSTSPMFCGPPKI